LASAAAGVVLMTNDLRRLADGIMGARRTARACWASVLFGAAGLWQPARTRAAIVTHSRGVGGE
jgi:hypothetical protein